MLIKKLGDNNLTSRSYEDLVVLRDECLLYQAFKSISVSIEELEGYIAKEEAYQINGFHGLFQDILMDTNYVVVSLGSKRIESDSQLGQKIELLKKYIVSFFKRSLTSYYKEDFIESLGDSKLHNKMQDLLGPEVLQDPTVLLDKKSTFFDDRVLDDPHTFGDKVFNRNEEYNHSVTLVGVEFNISAELLNDHELLHQEGYDSILSELHELIATKKRDILEGDVANSLVDTIKYSTLEDVLKWIDEGIVFVGGNEVTLLPEEQQKLAVLIQQIEKKD